MKPRSLHLVPRDRQIALLWARLALQMQERSDRVMLTAGVWKYGATHGRMKEKALGLQLSANRLWSAAIEMGVIVE